MQEIESSDLSERLVGITPAYLNKFVQQQLYGIKPSVQAGQVRAQRRVFSEADVFGIALAWLLFESGLRTDPIRRVLKEIASTSKANANAAAKKLLQSKAEYLVVLRQPRPPAKVVQDKPAQTVRTASRIEIRTVVEENAEAEVLVIPVGRKFADIQRRLEILFPR